MKDKNTEWYHPNTSGNGSNVYNKQKKGAGCIAIVVSIFVIAFIARIGWGLANLLF